MASEAERVRRSWARQESARWRISLEESLSMANMPSRSSGRCGCRSTCSIECSVDTQLPAPPAQRGACARAEDRGGGATR